MAEYDFDEERPYGHHHHTERSQHHHERGHQGRHYEDDYHDARKRTRAYDWEPKRPKVDFPKFDGRDPYEWLDKANHYFHTYNIPMQERVATNCFYLEGKLVSGGIVFLTNTIRIK